MDELEGQQPIQVGQVSVKDQGYTTNPNQSALMIDESRINKYSTRNQQRGSMSKTVQIEPQAVKFKTVTSGEKSPPKKLKKFNPEVYRFKKPEYNVQQEMFIEKFYQHEKANKSQINKQLVEQTYLQVLNQFDKEKKKGDFPAEFRQSEMKWAGQMMRSKKLQKLMSEMTERVAILLEDELRTNRQLVKDWIQYPHSQTVSPKRNQIKIDQLAFPIWYPERPPVSHKVQTVYNKHRQHLNSLAEKKRQEKQDKEDLEMQTNQDLSPMKAKKTTPSAAQGNQPIFNRQNNIGRAKRRMKSQGKPEKPSMTPYQEAIYERLQIAKSHIEKHEEIDELFHDHLEEIEKDLRETSKKKAGKNPGNQIKQLLSKWADEPVYTEQNLAEHRHELWISLEQFEADLKNQEYAMEIELKNAKIQYRTRVDGIRSQTSMRIEALESALIETKIRYSREMERAQMQLSEMESRLLNQSTNDEGGQLERVANIEATLNDPQFENLDESKQVQILMRSIKRLTNCVRASEQRKTLFAKQMAELQSEIDRNTEFNEQTQADFRASQEKLLYYQQVLYEILENIGMLEGIGGNPGESPLSEEKQRSLRELLELNESRIRQDEQEAKTHKVPSEKKTLLRLKNFVKDFHQVIVTVDFRSIFQCYQQMIAKKDTTLDEVTAQFAQLGVLDLQKLQPKVENSRRLSKLSSSPTSPGRRNTMKQKQPSLSEAEQKTLQLEQHLIKVDGLKLHQIQEQFKELKRSMQEGITEMIMSKELLETVSESASAHDTDGSVNANKKGTFGINVAEIEAKTKNMNPKEKQAFQDKLKKNQAKREVEQEKREKRERSIAEKRAKLQGNSNLNKRTGQNTNAQLQVQKKQTPVVSNSQMNNSRKNSAHKKNENENKVVTKASSRRVTSEAVQSSARNADDSQLKIKLNKIDKENVDKADSLKSHNSVPSDSDVEEIHDDTSSSHSDDVTQISKSAHKSTTNKSSHVSHSNISSVRDKLQAPSALKKEKFESSHKVPPQNKVKVSESGKLNKEMKKEKSEKKQIVGSSRKLEQSVAKRQVDKKKTEMSVSIVKNSSQKSLKASAVVSEANGSVSGECPTEPIDHTQQVLEELENKVLLKYSAEIEEIEESEDKYIKLKTDQNREILHAFKETLGTPLTDTEETQINCTGKLPVMIDLLNTIRDNYTQKENSGLISVKRLESVQKDDSDDISPNLVPLGDCILTQINEEGQITGFTVRVEILNVIKFREFDETKQGITQIVKAIKTVNYLNRLFFNTEKDYWLGIRGEKMPANIEQKRAESSSESERPPKEKEVEIIVERRTPTPQPPSEEFTDLMDLIRKHAATLLSKGQDRLISYQQRIWKDKTLEELMHCKVSNVYETLSEDQREDMSIVPKSSTTIFNYLEILFQDLETKIKTVMPQENKEFLSINELVNQDGNPSVEPVQKDESRQQTPKKVSGSGYGQEDLYPLSVKKHESVQTGAELMEEYMRQNSKHLSMVVANQHIDQQVGREMEKTIASLNCFVSKVQMQSQMIERDALEKQKEGRIGGASSMFDTNRKSMATQLSSNMDMGSVNQMSQAPIDQLKAIQDKVQASTDVVQGEIDLRVKQIEKDKAYQHAAFVKKRHEIETRNQKINFTQVQLNQNKLPNLNKNQLLQNERSLVINLNAEVSKMPLMHNSNTKPSALVQQPFKQTHKDRRTNHDDLTISKFSLSKKERSAVTGRRSQTGFNPPGLTAQRVGYISRSPHKIAEGKIVINDSSLESKDFGRTTTGSMMKGRNHEAFFNLQGEVAISSHEFSAKSQRRNTRSKIRTDNQVPFLNMQSSTLENDKHIKMFQPIALSYEMQTAPNKRNLLQVPQEQMLIKNQKGKYDLKLSLASTPQSSIEHSKPFTPGVKVMSNRDSAFRQHINVGRLSKNTAAVESFTQRKTSTTMMMMHTDDQEKIL